MRKRLFAETAIVLTLLCVLALTCAVQRVSGSLTFYMRADGSVEPSTSLISTTDNTTYIFTGNLNASIVVERDNILIDGMNHVVQGAGTGYGISLVGRRNVTLRNIKVASFSYGIYLEGSQFNVISGNNITGNIRGLEFFTFCDNNSVLGNYVNRNTWGIRLLRSSNNTLADNEVSRNGNGISMDSSSCHNCILRNKIVINTASGGGILCVDDSNENLIAENNIADNGFGISIAFCGENTIKRNTITGNMRKGISLQDGYSNLLYHNIFINNNPNYLFYESPGGILDKGYPLGGNYWSDYEGVDAFSGPYQNETGSDGIGDTPYPAGDQYPFMNPYICVHNIALSRVTPYKTIASQGYNTSVSIKVANEGDGTELLRVTAYANSTLIGSSGWFALAGESSLDVILRWNTTDFARAQYVMEACASPVSGERYIVDNNLTSVAVAIVKPGDINADGKVDLKDVFAVGRAYGRHPGEPGWDSAFDIIEDQVIDLKDYFIVCRNFGKDS